MLSSLIGFTRFLFIWKAAASSLWYTRKNRFFFVKMNVDHEITLLTEQIHRLGSKNADGKVSVKFGVLFNDDECANIFEAMVGTLKAAKKRKIVSFDSELLLQGVHDNVDVVLL
ncbi:hypothetical protein SKAU_G00186390 [Synaphobranchus kaupii]|uniref:Costars family protein ABRACL n=1 Tax=Synaphobranchus kaupii TaxID=118154 RepID=A0A9Q1FCK2_SYNKA|nr:hypothetical protein SKAU_G00186390 [Synaphobranchus kaupii]